LTPVCTRTRKYVCTLQNDADENGRLEDVECDHLVVSARQFLDQILTNGRRKLPINKETVPLVLNIALLEWVNEYAVKCYTTPDNAVYRT